MSLWMAIRPGPTGTRVLVTEGQETLLKARLMRDPAHPRALATLLEAMALWQESRSALCSLWAGRALGPTRDSRTKPSRFRADAAVSPRRGGRSPPAKA